MNGIRNGGRRRSPRTDWANPVRLSRAFVVAVVAIGLSMAVPAPAAASSTTQPAATSETTPASGSASAGGSTNYSPPALSPIALIGAGFLVLVAIVWTLRPRGGGSSDDDASDVEVPSRPPVGQRPGQRPDSVPPRDLSSD